MEEDSLLDLLVHLFGAALLAAGLCAAAVVAAGSLAFVIWAVARAVRGVAVLARRARTAYSRRERRPHVLNALRFPHRPRRP